MIVDAVDGIIINKPNINTSLVICIKLIVTARLVNYNNKVKEEKIIPASGANMAQ